ncbi:MAG TPA: TIR domain-containing protein, partial [Anaerolineales bacterium]|nr:TIR domain-containing protein [Anaerolineales bacterium]
MDNNTVFISYANEDKERVKELSRKLQDEGIATWVDEEQLLPGQVWELEIEKAIKQSGAVVLCLSKTSISKEGFVQKEYKRAIEYQQEKPEGTIFVIPVRLDDCEVPFFLKSLQYADFPSGFDKLKQSLIVRLGSAHYKKTEKQKEILETYLRLVINEASSIQLPYSEGIATIPLEQIYVSLKADFSTPVERKASTKIFTQMISQDMGRYPEKGLVEEDLYKLARYDPYAARYWIYDPNVRKEINNKSTDRNRLHIAEIVRRYNWAVLLGDPGSGKSTLARWLSLQMSKALLNGEKYVYVKSNLIHPSLTGTENLILGEA